jgi:hypothetical protein
MKGYLVVLEVAAIYKPGCKQELVRVLLDREDFGTAYHSTSEYTRQRTGLEWTPMGTSSGDAGFAER